MPQRREGAADRIPDPALVVLVGPPGSGKSTWARQRYRDVEIVSSDALRGVVGSGPADLDATGDAFTVLDHVVRARLRQARTVAEEVTAEGWDLVLRVRSGDGSAATAPVSEVAATASPATPPDPWPELVLQLSSFPWGGGPGRLAHRDGQDRP
jgi:hypothetical protein